jgi:hypothetical protein
VCPYLTNGHVTVPNVRRDNDRVLAEQNSHKGIGAHDISGTGSSGLSMETGHIIIYPVATDKHILEIYQKGDVFCVLLYNYQVRIFTIM